MVPKQIKAGTSKIGVTLKDQKTQRLFEMFRMAFNNINNFQRGEKSCEGATCGLETRFYPNEFIIKSQINGKNFGKSREVPITSKMGTFRLEIWTGQGFANKDTQSSANIEPIDVCVESELSAVRTFSVCSANTFSCTTRPSR